MTPYELAQYLDVTLVRNTHRQSEIESLIEQAKRFKFACVFTLPCYLKQVVQGLKGSGVHSGGTAGFPSGGEFTETKLFETKMSFCIGADEMDVVINLGWLLSGHYAAVLDELKCIREAAEDKTLKCIIEIGCLDDYSAKKACELVLQAGADYIKTGTGWFSPATIEQVRLIKSVVGNDISIKAAGGIRDLEFVEALKAEGVKRIGISLQSAVYILSKMH